MDKVRVRNMTGRTGKPVPNQFIVKVSKHTSDAVYFQSYQTIIAMKNSQGIFLDPNWDYSVTTGRYRNQFLGETKKETMQKIASGEYQIKNLN